MIKKILSDRGYIIGRKYQGNNPDYKPVYLIYKDNKEYFAKYFDSNTRSWNEHKNIHKTLSDIGFTPEIKEIIDINEESGIIINTKFGESYYRHLRNKEYYNIVKKRLDEFHNCGYIHGEMNACNILIDTTTNNVMFIDLNDCLYKSDPRLLEYIDRYYEVNNFEDACNFEIDLIKYVPN